MTFVQFLDCFVEFVENSNYNGKLRDLVPSFLQYYNQTYNNTVKPTDWEWEKVNQRFSNMDLFYSVLNEFSDPTEIYLVRKEDNKIVGRLVNAKFE